MSQSWYPRYFGDYMRDTGDLSLEEDGAYNRLLDYYYANDGRIPASAEQLHRICRAVASSEQKAVQTVVHRFFKEVNGMLVNARADRELAKQRDISEKRRKAAEKMHAQAGASDDANAHANARAKAHTTTTTTTTTETTRTKKGSASPPVVSFESAFDRIIPDELKDKRFIEAWHSWVMDRRARRKPVTVIAAERQLQVLNRMGLEKALRSIDQSIQSGWAGLFDPDQRADKKRATLPAAEEMK